MVKTKIDYRLVQYIKLANGQKRTEVIELNFGIDEGLKRLLNIRDAYRQNGFDVDLLKFKEVITTQIVEI
jgi:hypothetical protein